MEERNKVKSIFKSHDPEKLVVFHAASLPNEIRFYLNDTQYLTAIECEEGCLIRLEEEIEEEYQPKSKLSIIMENWKECAKIFSVLIGILILTFIGMLYLYEIINNIFVFLIIMKIICFANMLLNVIISESMVTSPTIKSKHSAEHMMINFLESNKRLPKNIEEVKKSSRFSSECGSIDLIDGIAEELIRGIVAIIFTFIVSVIVSHFSFNSVLNSIVFLSTYFLTEFVVGKVITKYGVLSCIIDPIEEVLANIAQCANTTSKVNDRDIILAYSVAKAWLQVVYPEFYNENEDIFCKEYLKVNNYRSVN